jgi:hypothetical protein
LHAAATAAHADAPLNRRSMAFGGSTLRVAICCSAAVSASMSSQVL